MVLPVANATYIFCSMVNIEDLLSGSWFCIYMTNVGLQGWLRRDVYMFFEVPIAHMLYMSYQSMNPGVV